MINNTVYVIVVTYNGEKWIEKCIDSVLNSTCQTEIVIIDNGSIDHTLDIVKSKYPEVTLIETGINLGFGKANNVGIRFAFDNGARYIYLLNQDAWVAPNAFEEIIKQHDLDPIYGILSPIQKTGDGAKLDMSFRKNAMNEARSPRFLKDWDANAIMKDLYETTYVMAAHWMLFSDSLKQVGLFSPAFPHYGEDNNLCQRFLYWGYKIGVCSKAIGYHDREYRKNSPEKKLYIKYINFITDVNNPNTKNSLVLIYYFILFIGRCIKRKNVSLRLKFTTIFEGCRAWYKASHYKFLYKQKKSFIEI